ncbi:MAG: leucine-rich repeat domain-containing protein [Cytophagales bacterium]|jgi:hypothetical protein|nr:leucine-rich repeat domain-containing protein [Cytophagales bacterium]
MRQFTICALAAALLLTTAATPPSAEEHYRVGLENLRKKDYVAAIGKFTEAVSLNPAYADAYYQRSKAKVMLAQQKGYMDNEHYTDLLQAMRLGKTEAVAEAREGYAGECVAGLSHQVKPEEVYCLDASTATLKRVPEQFAQMSNLVQLSLADNQLADLTAVATHNKTLLFLDVRRNRLESLPAEIGNLTFLQELNLRDNSLTKLPAEMAQLKHLQVLNLAGNPIADAEKDRIRRMLPNCRVYFGENETVVKARGNAKFRPNRQGSYANGKAPKRF